MLGNSQSKSCSTLFTVPRFIGSIEAIKDVREILFGDANTLIHNFENHPLIVQHDADINDLLAIF
ncbi:hypothetical protein D3C84_1249160 [compost metagenome]